RNDIQQILDDITSIENEVGDQYKILVKVHPFLYPFAKKDKDLKGRLVSDIFETNELLSIVDILITDYSSIFFDFLVTNKPILFYMWDFEDYNHNRGMYIDINNLPGPVVKDVEGLIASINNIEKVSDQYRKVYSSFTEKF